MNLEKVWLWLRINWRYLAGIVVLVLLAVWVSVAMAGDRGHDPSPAPDPSASVGDVFSEGGVANVGDVSAATSSSSAASSSAATSSDASADNSVTNAVAFNATRNNNTPGVYLGGLYPSANCMGVGNLGVSAPGFGIGGGKSYPDPECDKRETARSFMALGYPQEALFILCSTQAARVLARCPYEALPEPEPVKCSDEQCEQAIEKKMDDMRKVWEGE